MPKTTTPRTRTRTRTRTATLTLALALISPFTASAQAAAPTADMTDGEVRKVDKDGGKLTLKHGEIKNLDMPGMTMVFVVKDKAMLDTVKAGDKVRFKAVSDGGKLTITQIDLAK